MMLPEMTSSARVARAFPRFARGAVVGLALAGLAACGGGGSSKTPSTPTTPEMTITPVTLMQAPMAELEAATAINAGETVEGTLESADDVKYYRLDVAETSEVEVTIDAEEGIEIALVDSNGIVLADATTASKATVKSALTEGAKYIRVKWKDTRSAVQKINRKFSFAAKVTKYVGVLKLLANLSQGRFEGEIQLGNVGGEIGGSAFDLAEIIGRDDGGPLTWYIGGAFDFAKHGSVSFRIEREVLRATPDSIARPGAIVLTTICAVPADVSNIADVLAFVGLKLCVPGRFTLVEAPPELPRRKPGVPASSTHVIQAGESFTSGRADSYFEWTRHEGVLLVLDGSRDRSRIGGGNNPLRFHRQDVSGTDRVTCTPGGSGWCYSLGSEEDDGSQTLTVSSTPDMEAGQYIVLRWQVREWRHRRGEEGPQNDRTAYVDFRVEIEPEEEEPGNGAGGAPSDGGPGGGVYSCRGRDGTLCTESSNANFTSSGVFCDRDRDGTKATEQQSCPRTGTPAPVITSCSILRTWGGGGVQASTAGPC